jgi:hypothetical protein
MSRRTPGSLGLATHLVGDDLSLLARHRDGYLSTVPPEGASGDDFIVWLDQLQMELSADVR